MQAELWGPAGSAVLRLALDTGATGTLVNVGLLVAVGYDPALSPDRVQVTTGSGVEFVPCITLEKIRSLGKDRLGGRIALAFQSWVTPCHRAQALMASSGWTSFATRA